MSKIFLGLICLSVVYKIDASVLNSKYQVNKSINQDSYENSIEFIELKNTHLIFTMKNKNSISYLCKEVEPANGFDESLVCELSDEPSNSLSARYLYNVKKILDKRVLIEGIYVDDFQVGHLESIKKASEVLNDLESVETFFLIGTKIK